MKWMSTSRGRKMSTALIVVGAVAAVAGGLAMASIEKTFGWEWRADRVVQQIALVRLGSVKKEGGGLFGILKSPSLEGSLPDPMKIEAKVLSVDREGQLTAGETLGFRMPKYEMQEAAAGDAAAIGLIDDVVVCFIRAPSEMNAADLEAWLYAVECD